MVAVAMVFGVALVGCGSSSSSRSSTTTPKDTSGGVSTGVATGTPVAVELGDTSGTNGPMTLTMSPASVPAGKITFTVKNAGTIKHEMVVLKATVTQLVVGADGKVSEASTAGEVGEVEIGKSKAGSLTLKAGTYEVVCNIKDHYGLGMHATLTVT